MPSPVDENTLLARIEAVLASTEGIRSEMVKENEKRDRRIATNTRLVKWAIRAAAIATLAAVIGIGVAVAAVSAAHEARHAAHESRQALTTSAASTREARVNSCLQQNIGLERETNSQIAESHAFVAALAAGSTAPDIAQRVATFNTSQDALIRSGHPKRDCTPQGIEKYLSEAPASHP